MGLHLMLKFGVGGIVKPFISKNASVPFEVCAGTLSCKRVRVWRQTLGREFFTYFSKFFIANRRYSFKETVSLWGIGN